MEIIKRTTIVKNLLKQLTRKERDKHSSKLYDFIRRR